uniref:Mitochondrial intermembrane space import and assembly protein 40 (Trinotate prediction) n=1 Tax=Henneguya salminicola TaxID=69463 RepID=A0A6G3MNC9_HENSL
MTEEELRIPSKLKFKNGGIYNPDGSINWDCPCLGNLPTSICGEPFKLALNCLINSKTDPVGLDCIDLFEKINSCFKEHPELLSDETKDIKLE